MSNPVRTITRQEYERLQAISARAQEINTEQAALLKDVLAITGEDPDLSWGSDLVFESCTDPVAAVAKLLERLRITVQRGEAQGG